MPLDTKIGLDPAHIALDGDPAPLPQKGGTTALTLFSPCLLWLND